MMSKIHTMPGHLIRRMHQISVSIFASHMKTEKIDLTSPQFAALSVLDEKPGIDQATLAGMIALDRPTAGGVIDRLVGKGLVQREKSKTDKRAMHLELTAAGKKMVKHMLPPVIATQDKMLEGLTPKEKEQFIALALKITQLHNEQSRAPLIFPKDKNAV